MSTGKVWISRYDIHKVGQFDPENMFHSEKLDSSFRVNGYHRLDVRVQRFSLGEFPPRDTPY